MNVATLLAYRGQLEELLRAELTVVRNALATAREELVRDREARDEVIARKLDLVRAGVMAGEFEDAQREMESAVETVRHAEAKEREMAGEWTKKLAEVLQATRERRKLEILDERERESRRRLEEWRDQRSMDDHAARRAVFGNERDERYAETS